MKGGAAIVPHPIPSTQHSRCHVGGTHTGLNKALRAPFTQKPWLHSVSKSAQNKHIYFRKQNQEIIQTQKSLKDGLVQSPEFTDEETEAHRDEVIFLIPGLRSPRYRQSWCHTETCVNWITFSLSYLTIWEMWFYHHLAAIIIFWYLITLPGPTLPSK